MEGDGKGITKTGNVTKREREKDEGGGGTEKKERKVWKRDE